ncbi:MAG: hypothetical protein ABFD08_02645 [Syntrophomonas sp.]
MSPEQAAQLIDLITQIKGFIEDIRYIAIFTPGLILGGMCGICFWITMRGVN